MWYSSMQVKVVVTAAAPGEDLGNRMSVPVMCDISTTTSSLMTSLCEIFIWFS